jgi:hypothetical protein
MLKSLLSFNFVNYFKFQGKVDNRYQIFFSPLIGHISICNAPAIHWEVTCIMSGKTIFLYLFSKLCMYFILSATWNPCIADNLSHVDDLLSESCGWLTIWVMMIYDLSHVDDLLSESCGWHTIWVMMIYDLK